MLFCSKSHFGHFTSVSLSLRSHSAFAIGLSIAQHRTPDGSWLSSGTSSAMSQSAQYTPPLPLSGGLTAHHTVVAAPCSTLLTSEGALMTPFSILRERPELSGDHERQQ
jgi:hypothetical protein